MDVHNLAARHDLAPLEWVPITERLAAGLTQAPGSGGPDRHTCWLTTLDPDGAAHVTGIGALWADGTVWFETGETTRKARNLARDPRCSLALSTVEFDLTLTATAAVVRDPAVVAARAADWAAAGWPCRVDDSGTALTADYSAPSAGAPPWSVYRLTVTAATALAVTGAGGATTWRF